MKTLIQKSIITSFMLVLFLAPVANAQDIQWGVDVGVGGNGWGVGASIGNTNRGIFNGGGQSGFYSFNPGLPQGSILGIIVNTAYWLLAIFGVLGVIGFIISGILYITAAGSDSQMEKAKKALTYSIIGVVVGLIGFVVIQSVTMWLSGNTTFF